MVLLDKMVSWTPDRATCELTVKQGTPFVEDGRVNSLATIEYMGQAIAACLGHQAYVGGESVRVGMIIGCRRFDLFVSELNVGDALTVEAERVRGQEDISRFVCTVSRAETPVSEAQLTVYHPEKPPSLNGAAT